MTNLKKTLFVLGAAIGLAVSLSAAAGPSFSCAELRTQCDAGDQRACQVGYQHCPGFDVNGEP